jgi:hypothetical protein
LTKLGGDYFKFRKARMDTMKKTLVLLVFALAWALGTSAQTVTFAALPAVSNPTLLPNGYANLDWNNFSYVDPLWSGAGVGFKQGPNALDVAFMGGGMCELTEVSCSASISSNASTASLVAGFKAHSAIVAAGYHSETINVSAYNQGHFLGSQKYNLTTSLQQINFPTSWGTITQLVLDTTKGTVVLYALNMQLASALASSDVIGSPPNVPIQGPTAPIHIVDPLAGAASMGDAVGPIAMGPNPPKHVGPITNQLQSAGAESDGVGPIAMGPNPPKHVGPITNQSQSAGAESDGVGPIAMGPNPPKHVGPITRDAVGPIAIGPTPIKGVGSTAPKGAGQSSE